MKRATLTILTAVWCVGGLSAAQGHSVPSTAEKPNIIIIFNDDQGYQDLGCFGSPDIKTPNVDRLARNGMKFTDFYVAASVCSASRAALMTGFYPKNVNAKNVYWPNRGDNGLNPAYVTMAETLKSAGYATAAVGKWHLGDDPKYLPTNQGFDSYYGVPYSNDMFPAKNMTYAEDCRFREGESRATLKEAFAGDLRKGSPLSLKNKVPLMRGTKCIEFPADQRTLTRRYADEGIKFITESVKEDRPFFLYLANTMPHTPLAASAPFKDTSRGGRYGDTIEEIDYNIGRIVEHLRRLGVEHNTLVIFTSDNGPWLVKGDRSGSALPLVEGKFTTFEGGFRVPCIMKWPARIPVNTVCDEVASTIDLHPTLARIAGTELPETELDGKDISHLLAGTEGAESPHEYFFYVHNRQGLAVRSGNWKYHESKKFTVMGRWREKEEPALYNLQYDVGEANNVIDEYPKIAKRLSEALDEHLEELGGRN